MMPSRARRTDPYTVPPMAFDPAKYATATIVSRSEIAEDLWSIRISADCELPFRPGQYVTLGLPIGARIIERPYSIVSSPEEREIELFIERVPEGELSAPLYALGPGAELAVRKRCKGLFLKDSPPAGHDAVFVATVTGIAPFLSFLRLLRDRQHRGEGAPERRVAVLLGASFSSELGYREELEGLARDLEWLTFVPTISRPWDEPGWAGERGRVEDVLRKHIDALGFAAGSASVYLCGNPQMIGNARGIMRRAGLPDADIHEEQYWPE
jgi:ferredoxin--NADP+ reductase